MAHAIRMPKPGQMTEECLLSMWRKAEGEPVAEGDVVFEIETDKSTMEVESFHRGVLLRQVVAAGETVPVNTVCAWIGEPGETIPETAAPPPIVAEPLEPLPAARSAEEVVAVDAATAAGTRRPVTPRARALAHGAGIDLVAIAGSGPGGRILERDIAAAVAARGAGPSAQPVVAVEPGAGAAARDEEEGPRPLSRMRRVIADRLTLSATTIPTFSATVAADVTSALALREELRDAGRPVSVTDIVLTATAQTLAEFPEVNSRTDGASVWLRRRVHLGVAVALPTGLVVAVIRDADRLGLLDVHEQAERLVAAARAGKLGPDELTGSTFTVSNLGMHGIDAFTAIVNPGESGILAVASAVATPVVIGDGIGIRTLMRLTLSADHRLVDGELGARFLGALRRRLEDPVDFRRELRSR
ncbi:MAG TPA: dihydrolipoamide acetyltransferase family protein [Candidatus Limnocylindrales bacterium]|nr:dihydrolipoamide acetyltransferase family protein [Candidatus Limnocylindrales bacterium]